VHARGRVESESTLSTYAPCRDRVRRRPTALVWASPCRTLFVRNREPQYATITNLGSDDFPVTAWMWSESSHSPGRLMRKSVSSMSRTHRGASHGSRSSISRLSSSAPSVTGGGGMLHLPCRYRYYIAVVGAILNCCSSGYTNHPQKSWFVLRCRAGPPNTATYVAHQTDWTVRESWVAIA